jgi:hypothetical protein
MYYHPECGRDARVVLKHKVRDNVLTVAQTTKQINEQYQPTANMAPKGEVTMTNATNQTTTVETNVTEATAKVEKVEKVKVPSKMDTCYDLYVSNLTSARKDVIALFIQAGCTDKGASTYYQNCKKRFAAQPKADA